MIYLFNLRRSNDHDQIARGQIVVPIMFNTILTGAGIALNEVRLLRHQAHDATKGRTLLVLWRDERESFDLYQSVQGFKNRPRFGDARYWASFIAVSDNQTMFAGLYAVKSRSVSQIDIPRPHAPELVDRAGTFDQYDIELDPRFDEFDGKLYVDWGPGTRSWIQRPDQQNKAVIELRKEFKEPDFPGFSNFIMPLSKIESLPASWVEVLRSSRGIYLLTCPKTKEQYVGSADGALGFFGRWLEYARTGHGGNVGLKSRDASDYQVSVLEVAGSSALRDNIIAMEISWKQKLQSREMGLNRN